MAWKKSVKTRRAVSIVLLLLLTSFLPLFSQGSVKADRQFSSSYVINFEDPQFSIVQMNNETYVQMIISDCMVTDEIGSAQLPVYAAHIVIPDGCNIENIQITEKQFTDYSDVINEYMLLPAQPETRFSEEKNTHVFSHNHSWYQQNEFQPKESHIELGTNYMNGYPVQTVKVFPIRYNPLDRQLYFYGTVKVTVTYSVDEGLFSEKSHRFLRKNQHDVQRIKELVLNDEMLDSYTDDNDGDVRMSTSSFNDDVLLDDSYPDGLCDSTDSVDYVIVTSDSLSDTSGQAYNWSDLLSHRQSLDGLSGRIVTVEEITSCPDYYNETELFNDSAAQLREFCKDAYVDWNTKYILLGGSWQLNSESRQIVPSRIMTDVDESGSYDTMPSDLYFSNLDGDWYSDSESVWGAGRYGANDKLSELSVGRIPVWDAEMVSNAVDKIIWYDNCQDEAFLSSAGFLGGDLGWSSTSKEYMEEIRTGEGSFSDYVGFEEWNTAFSDYEINTSERYYDADYASESDAVNAWKRAINNGNMSLISHLDHGSWLNTLSLLDGRDLSNSQYFIGTSQACLSGRYTSGSSGASTFLAEWNDRGAFAMVLNTGYGYGSSSSTAGKSQLQHKIWWDYFFDNQTTSFDNWRLGLAMQYTKDVFSSYIDSFSHVYSYVWYSWNLFGDPAQEIRLSASENNAPSIVSPSPSSGSVNVSVDSSLLSISISDYDGDGIDWTIETSPDIGSSTGVSEGNGSKTCSIAGLTFDTIYTWFVNVSDGSTWTNETFTFTTESDPNNNAPIVTSPDPVNETVDVNVTLSSVSVTISDPDGDEFSYTIEGAFISNVSESDQINGTKTAMISSLLPFNTSIAWFVNATDGYQSVSNRFEFTTRSAHIPDCPTGFESTVLNRTSISLHWTRNNSAESTRVERNTEESWTQGQGTLVYNGSEESIVDTDLSTGTTFYYRAWSFNSSDNVFSSRFASTQNTTEINHPVVFSTVTPANNSVDCSVNLTFSIHMNDNDGDKFNWSIELNSSQRMNSSNEGNGTKNLVLSNLSFDATFTVWVNATDGFDWTKVWYQFTTDLPPDNEQPEFSSITINSSNPMDTDSSIGWENLTCEVVDNYEVSTVNVTVMFPDGSTSNMTLSQVSGSSVWFVNTSFSESGNYSMRFYAMDSSGNQNSSWIVLFSLVPNWDINNDGSCNLLDLNAVSLAYGSEGSNGWIREDVDNNGKISVLDLAIVSNHYEDGWWT